MDDYEDIEGLARRNRRRMKILAVVGVGIFAIPLGWAGYSYYKRQQRIDHLREENRKAIELTPDDLAQLKTQLADTKARIAAQHEVWKRVVTHEELAKIEPGSAPCDLPRMADHGFVQRESIGASYFKLNTGRVAAGEPLGLPYASVLAQIEQLEQRLAAGTATRDNVGSYELENAIAFIVVDTESRPLSTGTSFVPGEIVGRAYVYSATAQRIVCAAHVEVTNSEALQIDFKYMEGNYADKEYKRRQAAEWKLAQDLEANVDKALAAQLRAVP